MLNLPPRTLLVSVQFGGQLLSAQSEQLFMLRHSIKEINSLYNLCIVDTLTAKHASSLHDGWHKQFKQKRYLKLPIE